MAFSKSVICNHGNEIADDSLAERHVLSPFKYTVVLTAEMRCGVPESS